MPVEAVIWDIGNVLIEWHPEAYYDRLIGPDARRRMFAETDIHAVNLAIDAGAPYRRTIYDLADRHPDWAGMIRLWHDDQFGMLQPVVDRSVRMLRALRRRGVPVHALTNFGDESFASACAVHGFLTEFDTAFVSGRLGLTKPDPRI
jgi:2-haloacid dehalogenase